MKHLKKITTALLLTLLVSNTFGQKLFDDYKTVKNPLNDKDIVGKQFDKGFFSGSGTKAILISEGLSSIAQNDTTKFKSAFDIEVAKVVSGKINLSNDKAVTSNFSNIQIISCTDLSEIPFTNGKAKYVIGAIVVGSFDVSIKKEFDATLKAELDKEIAQKFNIKPEISYNKNKASVRLGGKLVVATKMIQVTKNRFYIEQRPITAGNKIEYNDELTNADNTLKFESMPKMDATTFTTDEALNDNKGVFLLRFINSSLPDPTSNEALSRVLVIAPKCSEMKGTIKPDCNIYSPFQDFQNITMKRIARGATQSYIVIYSVSVDNISATYEKAPKPDNKLSNFTIDNVTANITVRKNVYHYKIIR